jgi:hypothetical protein
MSRIVFIAWLAFVGASPVFAASEKPAMPSFQDFEYSYTGDTVLVAGRQAIAQAIPIGTPAIVAQHILDQAGARCKPRRNDPQTIRCIHNDLTIADEAVDDIRWKITLHVIEDKIASLSVDRDVDRKGPQD